ncbi:CPBP family intramembrane glutamic endopeptidase [Aquibacillus rhizosphaerae]|uniref:CPBP family intramembrane metalloprotease n=1 Tax=Aquibacillus rhizosphaerae TaxID=3051431 RepID=A0ABT7L225_9BACI|nr:CPBP family intramembrane glutamic endopeptidase [Aquibacillus sp. LR5S19]MDL4839878.1 CPBP family intramembrane metalloprotease [Aquibacillus sp. LR5S19]
MNNREKFFLHSPWTWKELIQLLLLVLVFVPVFIEYLLKDYLATLFQNDLYSGTLIGLIMSMIFMLGVYVFAIMPNNLSWKEVGLRRFSSSYWKAIIGWTIVLIVISIAMVVVMEDLLGVGPNSTKTDSLQSSVTLLNFFIGFISAAIISPVYEEIFYRGFLYRFIRSKYGIAVGMLSSSFIFMIIHIPTFNTLPVNFVSGLIFAWTYEKSGSVFPAMIIHGLFNGIAVIVTVLG